MTPYFESSIVGAPQRPRHLGGATSPVGHAAADAVYELHRAHCTMHAAGIEPGCSPRALSDWPQARVCAVLLICMRLLRCTIRVVA